MPTSPLGASETPTINTTKEKVKNVIKNEDSSYYKQTMVAAVLLFFVVQDK